MENVLMEFNHKCDVAEKRYEELEEKYKCLSSGNPESIPAEFLDDELKELISENKKLKYRIQIMKRSQEEQGASNGSVTKISSTKIKRVKASVDQDHMVNILGYLEDFFGDVVSSTYPDASTNIPIQIQVSKVADYQCNVAMVLAKQLGLKSPEVGKKLAESAGISPLISKLEASGPGFINIYLNNNFIQEQVRDIILKGVTPPKTERKRVVVDFSSPNIAKEMHVGHLRSTIIGESIARLLEFLGHDVLRINHLGDWGTQFGMLIAHLKEKFPNFLKETPQIGDLQSFYKESKKRFDDDPEFKDRAYKAVVQLQAHEESHYKAWRQICDISLKEFGEIYKRLGVTLEPRGESFYQDRMVSLVKDLDQRKLIILEDGRKVMYPDTKDIPLTIVKSDGGFTYDTSDMATIKQRIEEEKADWLIYVTDNGQRQHFKSFIACATKAGIYDPAKVRYDHVTFGVVLGEDKKKFKTRSGDTVRLVDLLNEGVSRACEKLKEKERDKALTLEEFNKAMEAVAYGCIKYADLYHDRSRDYIFSFDRMLDFRGNTAAYLLYALTRIRSIARKADVSRNELLQAASSGGVVINHEKEIKLAKVLLKISDVLVKITKDLYLHPLCEYLYEISITFTEFYDNCYCIEKDSSGTIIKKNMNRLLLVEATATVMQKCFDLLGIETLEKM